MKIAFAHSWYPGGGTGKITSDLAAYLRQKGHEIYVFCEIVETERLCEADKRNITLIPTRFKGRKNRSASARFLTEKINALGIDILVTPMGVPTDILYIRENTRCKIVYALHSMPLWEMCDFAGIGTYKALRSGSAGKMAEWFLVRYPLEILTGRRRRKKIAAIRADYLGSDVYTVICEDYKRRMIEILGPVVATPEHNHIEVMPNWVQPRDYVDTVKKKKVLFIGRLSYGDKRVDRLLDIWAMVWSDFPDWELCIVGDGEEKERLVRQSERLQLGSVVFYSHTIDPGEFYRTASILCLTSSFEGWPLVIAEAQQAGVVPVAFDVSAGVHEQLAPSGTDGILVQPFDKEEYARQLAALMSDDDMRQKMSRNVVRKAREYSDVARLEKWNETFRKLLDPNP